MRPEVQAELDAVAEIRAAQMKPNPELVTMASLDARLTKLENAVELLLDIDAHCKEILKPEPANGNVGIFNAEGPEEEQSNG